MKRQLINVLLCGAMVLSAATFYSCKDDDVDDLKSRMTVIEGLIREIKAELENAITTGATITSATETDGIWTLVLSTGQTITITPTSGEGGGSSISVTDNGSSMTITINGKDYELQKAMIINSLVYSPEYIDGIVKYDLTKDSVIVKFLATPTPDAATVSNATFEIGEAHELRTRASGRMFKVDGDVKLDDNGLINVAVKPLNVEADKTYAVALRMTVGGSTISSNYFNIEIPTGYSFQGEDIEPNLDFIPEVQGYTMLTNGFSTAILPDNVADFRDEFNFTSLFANLPGKSGEKIEFELGDRNEQNKAIRERYDFFKSCLSPDGTWKMTGRPGTNGPATVDEKGNILDQEGILIYVLANDVIKAKIYWQVIDPIAAADWETANSTISGSPHYEYNEWDASQSPFDIIKEMYNGDWSILHSQDFPEKWGNYEVDKGNIVYVDGGKLYVGDLGKEYSKFSKGIYFRDVHTSLANGRKEIEEGTVVGQPNEVNSEKDGISEAEMAENGVSISEDGFIIFDPVKYVEQGFRVGPGIRFEYDYGEKVIGSDVIAFFWFNRR